MRDAGESRSVKRGVKGRRSPRSDGGQRRAIRRGNCVPNGLGDQKAHSIMDKRTHTCGWRGKSEELGGRRKGEHKYARARKVTREQAHTFVVSTGSKGV
jgi:hypothetical protein